MGDEGSEGEQTPAARAARLRGGLPETSQEVLDPQGGRSFDRGLPEGGARPVERGARAAPVEPVAARRLQPRHGDVREVAGEERLGVKGHDDGVGPAVRRLAGAVNRS